MPRPRGRHRGRHTRIGAEAKIEGCAEKYIGRSGERGRVIGIRGGYRIGGGGGDRRDGGVGDITAGYGVGDGVGRRGRGRGWWVI